MRAIYLIVLFFVAGCSTAQPTASVQPNAETITLPVEGMTFRRIDPTAYGTNAPSFHLLETEVTNEMYAQYLRDIKKDKGDRELYRQEKERREEMNRSGTFTWTTASPSYDVDNESLLWTGMTPPEGKSSFPVALIQYSDAVDFCAWLTKRHPEIGEFRLPTKTEWTLAAYGDKRMYPWGDQWDIAIPCVSESEKNRRSSPVSVEDPTQDITPEGIRHLWGNVREYIQYPWRSMDVFWMGPDFKTSSNSELGAILGYKDLVPRNDWWGYTHNGATRMETLGFRVVLDIKEDHTTMHLEPISGSQ